MINKNDQYEEILTLIKNTAVQYPFQTALNEISETGRNKTITYGELFNDICMVTNYLTSHVSFKYLDRVGVIPKKDINSIILILGITQARKCIVILNPNNAEEKLDNQIQFTNLKVVFSAHDFEAVQVLNIDKFMESIKEFSNFTESEVVYDTSDPAIIFFTTGTTDDSKAVIQSYENVNINSKELARKHQIGSDTRVLCVLPLFYANGLEFTVFSTLAGGGTLYLLEKVNILYVLDCIESNNINIASVVPSLLRSLLKVNYAGTLKSLDYFVSAAAPLESRTAQEVYKKWGKKIIQGYGLTETTNFSTLIPPSISDKCYSELLLEHIFPVGVPLDSVYLFIRNAVYSHKYKQYVGEICIQGKTVAKGYLNNTLASNTSFNNDKFYTGDLGFLKYNEYLEKYLLYITGREKNVIKPNGRLISLDEIDSILLNDRNIYDAISYRLEDTDENFGLIINPKSKCVSHKYIENLLRKKIGSNVYPAKIAFTERIDRLENGKVNRSVFSKGAMN
ncbi:acyl--CoA ligase [Listeria booriae]|uniref:class I adenylate-forming enzyme family protein n=1 Tax=Listeria booriae TaxID=1552123 RepID=UPI0016285E2E|nr:class I adenylate-forming enzyme family protein [Listeria booriae]MBC1230296.1 acyl--CoA ligase [Listeria booriae]